MILLVYLLGMCVVIGTEDAKPSRGVALIALLWPIVTPIVVLAAILFDTTGGTPE